MTDSGESQSWGQSGMDQGPQNAKVSPMAIVGKTLFERFEVLDILGEGAMATVYKANDRESGRLVALKKVNSDDPETILRFAREVNIHGRLKHKNIVEAIDCLSEDGETYFVMEFLDGMSLQNYLHYARWVERERDIWSIIVQVSDALQHAHDAGVLHRDLKPANIFLHESPQGMAVKVLDFGIAKPIGETTGLTQAGTAVGSPMYMSPEQCPGKRVDTRSDVYSLGILCYEIITGSVPYKGQNLMTVLAAHCDPTRKAKPLMDTRPELRLVKHLNNIIMRALETDSGDRFSTAAEFRTAMTMWHEAIEREDNPAEQVEVIKRLKALYTVPERQAIQTIQDHQEAIIVDEHQPFEDGNEEITAFKQLRLEQKNTLRTVLNVQPAEETTKRRPNFVLIGVVVILAFLMIAAIWTFVMR